MPRVKIKDTLWFPIILAMWMGIAVYDEFFDDDRERSAYSYSED